MAYHLAQLNIAQFRLPQEHPSNADFVNNLNRVNAIAEQQDGFVWRMIGDGGDDSALDVRMFDDPLIISNMSLWRDIESLRAFVYRNQEHRAIMRRRDEWFDQIEFHLVLWWVEVGHIPNLEEAHARLKLLGKYGSTQGAFSFRIPFPAPIDK